MTEAEVKAQREALAKQLNDLKDGNAANETAIKSVQTTLHELSQKVTQLNLANNRAEEGEHGESAFYTYVHPDHVKAHPTCYVTGNGKAIRIKSHPTEHGGVAFGLADDPDCRDAAQRAVQVAVEKRSMVRRILAVARGLKADAPEIWTPKCDWELDRAIRSLPPAVAKIFANSSGIGSAFMPTMTSAEFEREVLATNNMSSMFPSMPHPGGTVTLPYVSAHLQAFAHSIPTSDSPSNDTASSLGDGSATVTVGGTAVAAQVHRDAEEDAVIAVVPQIRTDMSLALAFADDNTNINGHTSGSQDALATWNVRGRLAVMTNNVQHQLRRWDGLRRIAIAASKNTSLNAAQTLEGFMGVINSLGIEQLMGADGESNIVVLVSPEFFFKKMLKPSIFGEFSTFDKIGGMLALLSGKLGSDRALGLPNQVGYLFNRFPVCLCYTLTADLNASGVWDNTTTDRTGMVVVDRTRYEQWYRKGAVIEQDVEIRNNTVTVVARKRNTFRAKRVGSAQAVAAYGYNLTQT